MTSGASISRKNPKALEGLRKRFEKAASKEIAVGFPKGKAQAYPDGTSVIEVAARHVFGVGVPVRDFMSMAKPGIHEKTKPILVKITQLSGQEQGDDKAVTALQNGAGQVAQAEIQQAIIELDDPPNAPSTIAAKGSGNPLIDTGHMKDSVTYVIRDKTK